MKYLLYIFCFINLSSLAQENYLTANGVPFRKGDQWGYADKTSGEILVEPAYDSVNILRRLPLVYSGGKCGLVHYDASKGVSEMVIPTKYELIYQIRIGRDYVLQNEGQYTILDQYYQEKFDQKFDQVHLSMTPFFYVLEHYGKAKDIFYTTEYSGIVGNLVRDTIIIDTFNIQTVLSESEFREISRLVSREINKEKNETGVMFDQEN